MPLERGLPPERNRKDRAKFHLADDCGIKKLISTLLSVVCKPKRRKSMIIYSSAPHAFKCFKILDTNIVNLPEFWHLDPFTRHDSQA